MKDPHRIRDHFYKFDHFFELSPDLLCIAGFDGYFKKINPSVAKALGYTNAELLSHPITDFVHPDDKVVTLLSRESLTERNPLVNFENRYLHKNGHIVWLSWTSMPVVEEKLVYAIAKNVTAKKKLEEERNKHLTNLTEINKDLKQLNYTTSHDLRSPVNNLLSLFDLLDLSKITDDENLEYIRLLRLTTENLSDVLNNSVDQLIQRDKLQVDIEELNLRDNLNSVLLSINSIIANFNVTVNTDFSAFEVIRFNKAYMESILLNLITNSIKYAQPGLSPVIHISSTISNGIKQLIVADNGIGFDKEQVQSKLFGLNQTFHNHSDSKGIGLYLVYNHVVNMKGSIQVDSKINEGTVFTISFQA